MLVMLCDLCGKPIDEGRRHFKVKERKFSWYESWWCWENIDVHDECVKKLLEAVAEEKDESSMGN